MIKTIDIICPLYNAENCLVTLHESLLKQKNVKIKEIKYILTESDDKTEDILKKKKLHYAKIKKKDFSHSLVREKASIESKADIIVFITQDISITDDNWLVNLVTPIIKNEVAATYSRQITKFNNIEKYIRQYNYPSNSFVKSKENIKEMGLKTFFFSDASSAIDTKVFKKLNYYDGKDLPINEDMYIAYKIIMNDYKIKYCANSKVYHSHNFSFKELYKRYKLTGKFFKNYNFIDKYGTNKSGGGLAKYILKNALKDKNFKVLLRYFPDMLVRYLGMKIGKIFS